ncbi:MAG: 16S rRNA (uracil(1498)-N(3))-methyltransferase [bacterium]
MRRFYCPQIESGLLDEEESRHAFQVLRLEDGSQATVFNGKGKEASVKLARRSDQQAAFRVLSMTETPRPACRLSLGQALPKGKSMDLIIQKATELGVSEIWPILSEHSVIRLDDDQREQKQQKWQQAAVEACKQCGQNWLPVVQPPLKPEEFLQKVERASLKLIASLQPGARTVRAVLDEARASAQVSSVFFLVGPEGDFTPAEIGWAISAGFQPVTLGPNILRSETAAIFLTSVLMYEITQTSA